MPPQPPPLSLDAITRAVAVLRPRSELLAELAETLRISVPAAERAMASQPPPSGGSPSTTPEEPIVPARTAAPSRKAPRVVRLFSLPDQRSRVLPPALAGADPLPLGRLPAGASAKSAPAAELLTPSRTARGLFKALLSSPSESGPVDVIAVIETMSRAEPIERLPLRPLRGLGRGATVVLDVGEWVAPFRRDALALVRALRGVVGTDRLSVVRTKGAPPFVEANDGSSPRLLHSGAPVLIISDFGLTQGEAISPAAGPSDWADFAREARSAGCEPIGLLPFPPSDWPLTLSRSLALLHWTIGATARDARRARECGAAVPPGRDRERADLERFELTQACAAAARIEPELLRTLRLALLPGSSPSVEAAVWWSDEIGSRGAAAATLDRKALKCHRTALRSDPALARRVTRAASSAPRPAPPVLRLEEEIVELDLLRPDGWRGAVGAKLASLLRTLLDGTQDPTDEVLAAARYVLSVVPELPLPSAARATQRDLMFVAAHILGAPPKGGIARAAPSPWIVEHLIDPSAAELPVEIRWEDDGLRFEPGGGGADVIYVRDPAPALSVTWPKGMPTPWLSADRPQRVEVPVADYAELRSLDGGRWGFEDADVADSLPPLRVFPLIHPHDLMPHAERFISSLESALRAHAGLPASAPVLMRPFQVEGWNELPTWRERPRLSGSISTWRSAVHATASRATAFVLLVSQSMIRGDWTTDALRVVESLASGAGGQAVPVIAIQWDGPNGTFDKFLSSFSFPQLSTRRLRRDEPSEVDSIARKLVRGWRRGPDAASAESAIGAFMPNPDVDEWLPLAMQGLVMAFHVMSFDPTPSSESGDLAANMWGYVGSAKGALHPNEAEGDFRFVRFMSEYLYSGPVRDYLSGKDPFEPSYSIEEIARALGEESKSRQSSEGSPLAIPAILESFRRFAPKNVLDRFRRDFGDPDELGNDWSDRRRLPTGDLRAVAEAIRPYTSQFDGWRRREQTSLSRCRTFPEFMEGFSGLLRHYLQSLARSRPDTEVRLGHPDWHANLNLARRTFPASFEYLNIRDREEGRPGSGDSMPIVEYADLVVSFSDLLMWQLRKRAGRREWDSQSAFAPM